VVPGRLRSPARHIHKIQESVNDENTPSPGFWNVHLFTPSNTLMFLARPDPTVKTSGNPEIRAMLTGQIQTIWNFVLSFFCSKTFAGKNQARHAN
jgi:hypothetical protein